MQKYEGQICRPPMERSSYMLGTCVGCAYNRCRFCMLFKHLKYRELPLDEIEEEILRVKAVGGKPKAVFVGDGNAFGTSMERLTAILEMINRHLPSCEMVNMDATVTDVSKKSMDELIKLREMGVRRLYLGIECGLEDVLASMDKDHTIDEAYAQIERLREAGLIYNAHIMTGICGKGRGEENARALAEFFNRTKPQRITNFSLMLHRGSPLYRDIQAGSFRPADELECLREDRLLLELMDFPCRYDGMHDALEVRVRGNLPEDKGAMLSKLDQAIAVWQDREPVYSYVE